MRFIGVATTIDSERMADLLRAEIQAGAELDREGLVEHTFVRADRGGFYIVLDSPDEATARRTLMRLPFIGQGAARIELVEIRTS